jgi:hypothetical protein
MSIGDIIGGTLEGNATEWNAGTEMLTLYAKPADKTTLDLSDDGEDPTQYVDVSGDTDIKIIDHGFKGSGADSWTANFNKSTTERCRLYVSYYLPSGTGTAKFYGSCSAEVIHSASGAGTAKGHSSGTGTAVRSGEGTGTAKGYSSGLGIAVRGGRGTGTAKGYSSGRAMLLALASGDGLLRGLAAAHAEIVANASAVGTAVFTATCSGGFLTEPLALHTAARTLSHINNAIVSAPSPHHASVACGSTHDATRNPRRNEDA